jgi:hypothetical protein
MITSRAPFALHYCITGVSSRRHAATRDYAETLGSPQGASVSPLLANVYLHVCHECGEGLYVGRPS